MTCWSGQPRHANDWANQGNSASTTSHACSWGTCVKHARSGLMEGRGVEALHCQHQQGQGPLKPMGTPGRELEGHATRRNGWQTQPQVGLRVPVNRKPTAPLPSPNREGAPLVGHRDWDRVGKSTYCQATGGGRTTVRQPLAPTSANGPRGERRGMKHPRQQPAEYLEALPKYPSCHAGRTTVRVRRHRDQHP